MLNSARSVLSEIIFEDDISNVIVKECCADLLDAIVYVDIRIPLPSGKNTNDNAVFEDSATSIET